MCEWSLVFDVTHGNGELFCVERGYFGSELWAYYEIVRWVCFGIEMDFGVEFEVFDCEKSGVVCGEGCYWEVVFVELCLVLEWVVVWLGIVRWRCGGGFCNVG